MVAEAGGVGELTLSFSCLTLLLATLTPAVSVSVSTHTASRSSTTSSRLRERTVRPLHASTRMLTTCSGREWNARGEHCRHGRAQDFSASLGAPAHSGERRMPTEGGMTSAADTRISAEPAGAAALLREVPSNDGARCLLTLCSFAQNWCDKNREKAEQQVNGLRGLVDPDVLLFPDGLDGRTQP
eukprot:754808-Hanusia_phi.AAC.4